MTITESKRHTKEDGSIFYQKHKIYLYKEDFASFLESFKEVKDFIINEKGTEIITLDSDDSDSKNEDSNQSVESVDETVGETVDENKDADQESDEDNKNLKFEDI